jgi:hypothetical protein
MPALPTSLLAVFTLAACAMEDLSEVELYLGCPGGNCHDNSPLMGQYKFWEGNLAGLPNRQGVKFGDFVSSTGAHYKPRVVGDKLQATAYVGSTVLAGTALTDGYLEAITSEGVFKINIKRVNNTMTFWIGPSTSVETYELGYTDPQNNVHEALCDNPPGWQEPAENGHFVEAPFEAALFTGDRYDKDTRRVTDISTTGTRNWFTIACAGSGLMKLHLNRHTTAGALPGFTTTQNERQALFKMFASDLFGDGMVFTHKGVPLRWQNVMGWEKLTGTEVAWEARWDQNGAQCLDTHRLGTAFAQEIADHGALIGKTLKPCDGDVANPTFWTNTLLVSAVPYAP